MSFILAAGAARMKLEAENYEARIADLEAENARLKAEVERLKKAIETIRPWS